MARPGKAEPKRSEGARLERRSFRAYLRRKERTPAQDLITREKTFEAGFMKALGDALHFVLTRQKRYDKRPGGL